MPGFIIRRLTGGFFIFLLILLISEWIISLIPGSYKELMNAEEITAHSESLNVWPSSPLFYFSVIPGKPQDQKSNIPIPEFRWNGVQNNFHKKLGSYLSLDFGKSLIDEIPVKEKFLLALPWSLILQIPVIALIIMLSSWIALRRVQFPDSKWLSFLDTGLIWIHSIPGFWLATLLLLAFANPDGLQWLPSGFQTLSSSNPFTLWFFYPHYLLLPVICLTLPSLAYLIRLMKNGLESSLQTMYWQRALSTGMSFKKALRLEAFPFAMISLAAWLAGIFPAIISGSLIIEQIFSIPGLGRLMFLSITLRDWPVVQFLFLSGTAMTILGFIVSDLLLRKIDPRIRFEK